MQIKTERLTLVPLDMSHLESAYAYSSDAALTKYMMFLPVESLEEMRKFIEDCVNERRRDPPAYYEFAVLLDGAHIGGVSLYFDTAPDSGELGWILRPEYQGRGYAFEAARALMDWARAQLGVRRFFAHCDAENLASQRVMRRLGMALTDATGARKNRGSDELRREYVFESHL